MFDPVLLLFLQKIVFKTLYGTYLFCKIIFEFVTIVKTANKRNIYEVFSVRNNNGFIITLELEWHVIKIHDTVRVSGFWKWQYSLIDYFTYIVTHQVTLVSEFNQAFMIFTLVTKIVYMSPSFEND